MLKLNNEQQRAVTANIGPVLVVAGPGSGKTSVITARVSYLMKNHAVKGENILVLSYTRASAISMRERFLNEEPSKKEVTFSTFHSIFLKILKAEYGLSDDVIISPELKQYIIGKYQRNILNDNDKSIYDDINLPEHYYESLKRKLKKIDMDDILRLSIELFENNPNVLNKYRSVYKHILIDEFQDVSEDEYALLRLLCHQVNNVFAVGDDDQSIYGFRGSAPFMLRRFMSDFKNAEVFILNTNYRSGYEIVNAAKKLIDHNLDRIPKSLTSAKDFSGIISFKTLDNMKFIRNDIALDIIKHTKYSNYKALSIAVLFRNNALTGFFEEYFDSLNIKGISLMTMHSAKGLEFDIVYIPEMNEGICPDSRIKGIKEMEEERRLFYVAVTRARLEVKLYAVTEYKHRRSGTSRFVKELITAVK